MTAAFIIRTATGYVGQRTISGGLRNDLPRDFAYAYSAAEASTVAGRLGLADYTLEAA